MAEPHCIESLALEIEFDSEDQALALQDRLGRFARQRLPQIVAEVFDQAVPAEECWQLDSLALDLGPVSEDWLEQQWERRLREELGTALARLRAELPVRRPPTGAGPAPAEHTAPLQARQEAALGRLLFFLRHGHLSWAWSAADPRQQPQALLLQALSRQPGALLAQWRASPAAGLMLERAALQFEPAALGQLVLALAGGEGPARDWAGEAQAWVETLLRLLEVPSSRLRALRGTAWLALLQALWRDGASLDAAAALRALLQALAPALGQRPAQLAGLLGRAAARPPEAAADAAPPRWLALWRQALATDATTTEAGADPLLHSLQQWLAAEPQANRSDLAWQALLQAGPARARQTVLLLARPARARQRMAHALSPARLQALLALWLTASQQALLQAAVQSPLLWAAPPAGEALDLPRRWAWLLDHLLLQPQPELALPGMFDALLLRQVADGQAETWLADLDHAAAGSHGGLADAPLAAELMRPLQAWMTQRRLQPAAPGSRLAPPSVLQAPRHKARLQARPAPEPQPGMQAPPEWHELPALLTAIAEPAPARVAAWLAQAPATRDLPAPLLAVLQEALALPRARERLPLLLAEPQRWALLARLRPLEQPALRQATRALMDLLQRALPTPLTPAEAQAIPWQVLGRELFEEGRRFDAPGYLQRLALHLQQELAGGPAWWQRLLSLAKAALGRRQPVPAARRGGGLRQWLAEKLRPSSPAELATLLARLPAPAEPMPAPPPPAAPPDAPLYIANAGLVLVAAYAERLFAMLKLTEGPKFASPELAQRAALLLQLVVTGSAAAPEPLLVLNKLLCGLPLEHPLPAEITPSSEEQTAVDGMLAAMVAHWRALGRTSVAGLRETFLQREGRLVHQPERGWQLDVQARSFDMLLDRLPWSFRLIKLPWMKEALHVEWR